MIQFVFDLFYILIMFLGTALVIILNVKAYYLRHQDQTFISIWYILVGLLILVLMSKVGDIINLHILLLSNLLLFLIVIPLTISVLINLLLFIFIQMQVFYFVVMSVYLLLNLKKHQKVKQ